mgnify:CR=1 FL=1
MKATWISEREVFICPVCEGDMQYWAAYDVLVCPACMGEVYDPDTGEEQGPIE